MYFLVGVAGNDSFAQNPHDLSQDLEVTGTAARYHGFGEGVGLSSKMILHVHAKPFEEEDGF